MPDKQIPYKTIEGGRLMMDVFLPPGHSPSAAWPGILFFHGGGWSIGNPGQFHQHCRYFASRGMVALSAEYRVAERHGTTPFECVTDGKSAVRWIRAHSAEMGIAPDRLVAGGGSAGAHVAAAAATVPGYDEDGEDCSISARPDALVLFFFNYRAGNNPYYYATVYEADRFLASLGHLDGEPTLQNRAVHRCPDLCPDLCFDLRRQ